MAITNRRVVTGLNEKGLGTVVFNDILGELPTDRPGFAVAWHTPGFPADQESNEDTRDVDIAPQFSNGSGILFFSELEAGYSGPFHATNTLDFVFITRGQVRIVLEDGEALLGPGDVIVDRGVAHQWVVVGDEPAVLASVVLPALPLKNAVTKASF